MQQLLNHPQPGVVSLGADPQVVDLTYHLTPLEIEILTIVAHDIMV
eukprot:COSAG03_NODE_1569_length_3861_cov_2645.159979_5_plen_46_part_00